MPVLVRNLLIAVLAAAAPATAYEVETLDGRSLEAHALLRFDGRLMLETEEGVLELDPDEVDYYGTFLANLGDEEGNALAFRQGSFLRYEALDLEAGRIRITVEDGLEFSVPESAVDFRATVLEGSFVELPDDYGGEAAVAKSRPRADRRSRSGRRRGR